MDEAIIQRFTNFKEVQFQDMPMSIHELGNSSVVPTLFDLLIRGEIKDQSIEKGDILLCFGRSRNERKCFYLQILKKIILY
jgi:3-oxoacyl-[acyl-carrier-protein] synthase-3